MRHIDLIVIHCTFTEQEQEISAKTIDSWHKDRGWNGIGYHELIHLDGWAEKGRQLNEVGAHAKGFNTRSIGLCLVGGKWHGDFADTFTKEQYVTLYETLKSYIDLFPDIKIIGHGKLPGHTKACPCFNVKDRLSDWEMEAHYGY